jgi:hypothetical protein
MSDEYNKPKSQAQLMLRDTEYEMILHGEYPKNLNTLIQYLDGLDFVVEEWLESLHFFPKTVNLVGCAEDATEVMMSIVSCRFAITDFLCNSESETSFMDVMKAIRDLKQNFLIIAKRYLDNVPLSNWYLDLPLKVQYSFKHLHKRNMAIPNEGSLNN